MKRYLYIIIGIVVAAVLAILIILFIKGRSSSPTVTTPNGTGSLPSVTTQSNSSGTQNNTATSLALPSLSSTTTSGAPQPSVGSFGVLSTNPVLDYFANANNVITAIQPNGQIITISNGQSTNISSSTTEDIISASFSYDGKKILVSFGDPTNPQATLFDTTTQTWTSLPQGMLSPQWSPNSYQIAYLSSSAGTGKLALSMINAASLKAGVATLFTLNANDMDLFWLSKNQFILSDKPTSYINGSVWLFNSTSDSLTPIVYESNGVEALWSRSTSTLGLVFSNGGSAQNPGLQLETTAGNVVQQLNFVTLPSKCLFNVAQTPTSTTATTSSAELDLYCGIPRATSGFSSARLPDDYETIALFTSDDIYKINTASGATQSLWSGATQNIDTSDLKIFNGTLFFINRYNQELYGLVLETN